MLITPLPSTNMYRLEENLVIKGVAIPKGYEWNGASIPPKFWTVLELTPFHPQVMKASLVHDYLYSVKKGRREDADAVFEELLREDGVPEFKIHLMHFAVRNWGHLVWTDAEDKELLETIIKDEDAFNG